MELRQRLGEQPGRVSEVDLLEHAGRQRDRADRPIALDGRHVRKVPVPRLEEAPVLLEEFDRVGFGRRRAIAARTEDHPIVALEISGKENAILVLYEKSAHPVGIVPPDLRYAGGDVDE